MNGLCCAAGITSRHVLDTIRKMGDKVAIPWPELFPGANPVALDMLSKLLVFDQHRRATVEVSNTQHLRTWQAYFQVCCDAFVTCLFPSFLANRSPDSLLP